jgi:hypothetical protein
LPTDKKFVALRALGVLRRMRNIHGRVLEDDNPNIGQIARLYLGMESLPACRAGIMVDNIIARDCMPIVEPIAHMNPVGREQ